MIELIWFEASDKDASAVYWLRPVGTWVKDMQWSELRVLFEISWNLSQIVDLQNQSTYRGGGVCFGNDCSHFRIVNVPAARSSNTAPRKWG